MRRISKLLDKRFKRYYNYIIMLIILLAIMIISFFGISIYTKNRSDKTYNLLNPDDGTIDLRNLNIMTTGNILLPGGSSSVKLGTDSTFLKDGNLEGTRPTKWQQKGIFKSIKLGGEKVDATAAELNLVTGSGPGLIVPGRAVVYKTRTPLGINSNMVKVTETDGYRINDVPIVANFDVGIEDDGVSTLPMKTGFQFRMRSEEPGTVVSLNVSGDNKIIDLGILNPTPVTEPKITEIIAGNGLSGGGLSGTINIGLCQSIDYLMNGGTFANGTVTDPIIQFGKVIGVEPLKFYSDNSLTNFVGIRAHSSMDEKVGLELPNHNGNIGDVLLRNSGTSGNMEFGKISTAQLGDGLTGGEINNSGISIGVSNKLTHLKTITFEDTNDTSIPSFSNGFFVKKEDNSSVRRLCIKSDGIPLCFPTTRGDDGNVLTVNSNKDLYWSNPVGSVKNSFIPFSITGNITLDSGIHGNGRELLLNQNTINGDIRDYLSVVPITISLPKALGSGSVYNFYFTSANFWKITCPNGDDRFQGGVKSFAETISGVHGIGNDGHSWPAKGKVIFLRYTSKCNQVGNIIRYIGTGGNQGSTLRIIDTATDTYVVTGTLFGFGCGEWHNFQIENPFTE